MARPSRHHPAVATVSHAIDSDPAALAGLADGTQYTLQNTSNENVLIAEAADGSPPDATTRDALVVYPGQVVYITPEAGSSVFAWTASSGHVVTTEAR